MIVPIPSTVPFAVSPSVTVAVNTNFSLPSEIVSSSVFTLTTICVSPAGNTASSAGVHTPFINTSNCGR